MEMWIKLFMKGLNLQYQSNIESSSPSSLGTYGMYPESLDDFPNSLWGFRMSSKSLFLSYLVALALYLSARISSSSSTDDFLLRSLPDSLSEP